MSRRVLRGVRLGEMAIVEDAPPPLPPPPPPPPVPLTTQLEPEIVERIVEVPVEVVRSAEDPDILAIIQDATDRAREVVEAAEVEVRGKRADADLELARARERLESAESEAERIRATATQESERLRAEAITSGFETGKVSGFQEGIAEGERQGRLAVEKAAAESLQRLTQLIEQARSDARAFYRSGESQIVELAVAIARKVVQREVTINPGIVTTVTEAAVQQLALSGSIRIRVNPADLDELGSYWAQFHSMTEADRTFEIIGDEKIGRGGCLIETRAGTLDAQLNVQLDEIARALN